MNSKFKVLFAAVLLFIACGVPMARATADTSDECQTLTPEQDQKILGRPLKRQRKLHYFHPLATNGAHIAPTDHKMAGMSLSTFLFM